MEIAIWHLKKKKKTLLLSGWMQSLAPHVGPRRVGGQIILCKHIKGGYFN